MENEIEQCLAYHVLRNAPRILGSLTTDHFGSLLYGATYRAVVSTKQFPSWRINGVLDSPAFFQDSFEIDTEFQGWRRSIDKSFFSPREILLELGERAERWHVKSGVDKTEMASLCHCSHLPLAERPNAFWPHFLERPAMYCGSLSGWGLYCCLVGMTKGGDWLSLPEFSPAKELLKKLTQKSEQTYGTQFAAFRVHGTGLGVLKWGNEIETGSGGAE